MPCIRTFTVGNCLHAPGLGPETVFRLLSRMPNLQELSFDMQSFPTSANEAIEILRGFATGLEQFSQPITSFCLRLIERHMPFHEVAGNLPLPNQDAEVFSVALRNFSMRPLLKTFDVTASAELCILPELPASDAEQQPSPPLWPDLEKYCLTLADAKPYEPGLTDLFGRHEFGHGMFVLLMRAGPDLYRSRVPIQAELEPFLLRLVRAIRYMPKIQLVQLNVPLAVWLCIKIRWIEEDRAALLTVQSVQYYEPTVETLRECLASLIALRSWTDYLQVEIQCLDRPTRDRTYLVR